MTFTEYGIGNIIKIYTTAFTIVSLAMGFYLPFPFLRQLLPQQWGHITLSFPQCNLRKQSRHSEVFIIFTSLILKKIEHISKMTKINIMLLFYHSKRS